MKIKLYIENKMPTKIFGEQYRHSLVLFEIQQKIKLIFKKNAYCVFSVFHFTCFLLVKLLSSSNLILQIEKSSLMYMT
jgi:hypothetical protein